MLRVNGLFDTSQFGTPNHTYPLPVKFGPDGSLYLATWGHDCCRAQLPTSQSGRLMRIDYIGDQVDTTAPVVAAGLAGSQNAGGEYLGRATLTLNATDSSGISRVEYSLDGTNWTRYDEPVAFATRGAFTVRYRAMDRANNTSEVQQVAFTVVAGESCLPALSDDFGSTLDTSRWSYRHPTTPTGVRAPSVADGHLQLPLGAFSLDLARTGPAAILAQPLPDGDFTLVAKVTAPASTPTPAARAAYAQAGLKLFQTNDNWIKVSHSRNADGNPTGATGTYFELAYEINGTRTLGTRTGLWHGQPADVVAARGPHRRDARRLLLAQRPRGDQREGGRARHGQHRHRHAGGVRAALHRRLRRQWVDDGELRLPALHAGFGPRPTLRRR